MAFSSTAGYVPTSIQDIMDSIMEKVNEQFGTSYTTENFVGTGFYKTYYTLAQRLQEQEVKTSEIFIKLQEYFNATNQMISRPVATSPGVIEKLGEIGFKASVKPMIEEDAGKISICVDVDETGEDYAQEKSDIIQVIKNSVAAGIVSTGAETQTVVLSNGQEFNFAYHLPDRIEPLIRLTLTLSENNQVAIGSTDSVKEKLMSNISESYSLGKNFEPQRYFTVIDAPWAAQVLLEYKIGEGEWTSAIYDADFDKLLVILLENIEVVES